MGAGQEGDTSTKQCSSWLAPPRSPGPRGRIQTQGRFNCGWTPCIQADYPEATNIQKRGVVISRIKYNTHPDIRSSHSLLIG